MSITSIFHPGRKAPRRPGVHERTAPAGAPVPDWLTLPVPAAQVRAERASGPQPVFTPVPAHPGPQQQRGTRDTQEFTPDFAVRPPRVRPYTPEQAPGRPRIRPLPPEQPRFLTSRLPETRKLQAQAKRTRINSLRYPACDLNASFAAYAAFMRDMDRITGTHGTDWWPLPAIGGAA